MLLETDRLILRRFRAGDAPALAAYRSDPDVARYQSWDAPFPLGDAIAFVAEVAHLDPEREGWFQYAVEARDTGELVGDVGVNRGDGGRQAELGFTLAPEHQGRGYATEAVRRIVDFLLVEEGLHRVHATLDARNERSARLLERLGFRREGLCVQASWWKGEWTDDLFYAVLASEWSRSSER
ncbi:GNAT family protein [Dactylosporangium fulvum]|uniref:GNAT family N-acetyltransferase n=1 Tax=Dactylosporangium fulvum TaxID=53359 RepID=A0ABY5W348_9ACTN|nr:GNAT family N-acetyltransferase [Dactylosporangium fulvum]UWP84472.1 GNAT family N-acetyltransferase [Dactylosporangium fulvum]